MEDKNTDQDSVNSGTEHPSVPRSESPLNALERSLLPCPFCGGRALIKTRMPGLLENEDARRKRVECDKCGARTAMISSSKQPAIEVWNTRAASAEYVRGLEDAAKYCDARAKEIDGQFNGKRHTPNERRRLQARGGNATALAVGIRALASSPITQPDPSAKRRLGTSNETESLRS